METSGQKLPFFQNFSVEYTCRSFLLPEENPGKSLPEFPVISEKGGGYLGKYITISGYTARWIFRANRYKEILCLQKFDMLLHRKRSEFYS